MLRPHNGFGGFGGGEEARADASQLVYTAAECEEGVELMYYDHRWCDSTPGRFLTSEPIGEDVTNDYPYVGGENLENC